MSEEYIRKVDADDWLKQYGQDVLHGKYKFSLMYIWKNIMDLPSADVVQVRHGKWKYKGVCGIENNIAIRRYKCSECREDIVCDYPYNFCPNCGAKMDAQGEE